MSALKEQSIINNYKKKINANFRKKFNFLYLVFESVSWISHILCIYFAYFYAFNTLLRLKPDAEPVVLQYAVILVLIMFELLKRGLTIRFADEHILAKFNWFNTSVIILGLSALLMNTGSFYITYTGSSKFSDKSEILSDSSIIKITAIEDSTVAKIKKEQDLFSNKIIELENKRDIQLANAKILINKAFKNDFYKSEMNDSKKLADQYNEQIKKIRVEADNIETKYNNRKLEQINRLKQKTKINLNQNNLDTKTFVIFSLLLEILILGSLYFIKFFEWKSSKDWDTYLAKNESVRKYFKYLKVLDCVYESIGSSSLQETPVPSSRELFTVMKVKGENISESELNTDFFKIMSSLGIVQTKGNRRYLAKDRDDAVEILSKSLNI